ncbi:MAG: tRNA (adenosine(37)-N6)-dimethylallyltransferase MiaA, partial [Lachnospiraceae bacterium]|nr:tRNA (adenosine(37)-N6)-dimethylallyltransferase MiaA [Lachnospiraceae bacterium]
LYPRIDRRIDIMLEKGLVEEVKRLLATGCNRNMVSMQGLGYKEVIDYINGDTTYDEMVYILKRDTRHFAKRQLTWFKREKDVIWLDKDKTDTDGLIDYMLTKLREKKVI